MENIEKNLKNNNDEFAVGTGAWTTESKQPFQSESTQSDSKKMGDTMGIVVKIINVHNKEIKKMDENIKSQKDLLKKSNDKIEELDKTIHNTELRSIEVIGIISAIIALVLIFVDTANAQRSLKDSYSILVTGTASLILFASLLHHFFNENDKRNFLYYILFFGIPLLAIISIGCLIFKELF